MLAEVGDFLAFARPRMSRLTGTIADGSRVWSRRVLQLLSVQFLLERAVDGRRNEGRDVSAVLAHFLDDG
jgi:hypothetical protein